MTYSAKWSPVLLTLCLSLSFHSGISQQPGRYPMLYEAVESDSAGDVWTALRSWFGFHWNRVSYQPDAYFRKYWPTGIVSYRMSPEFDFVETMKIRLAMKEIEMKSCVRFVNEVKDERALLIMKTRGQGCSTREPEQHGQSQVLSLDPTWCLGHGRILHELMHALGFTHEHQRPDRDDYVEIIWANIKEEEKIQFRKRSYSKRSISGFPYDYSSILHYANISKHAAIDPNKPIIVAKRLAPNMGQRKQLDDLDVQKINLLYECGRLY